MENQMQDKVSPVSTRFYGRERLSHPDYSAYSLKQLDCMYACADSSSHDKQCLAVEIAMRVKNSSKPGYVEEVKS